MDDKFYVASTWRRLFAHWIDRIIVLIGFSPAAVQLTASFVKTRTLEVELRWLIMGWLLGFFYHLCFVYFMGATFGKLLFQLRVVSRNGELTLWQALLRTLTNELSIFFGLAPQALALLRLDRTHLADWVAETQVVQFFPRNSPPVRRKILAPLLVLFLAVSSFQRLYREVQNVQFENGRLIFDTNR